MIWDCGSMFRNPNIFNNLTLMPRIFLFEMDPQKIIMKKMQSFIEIRGLSII
jgi:hypothetical protein